MTSVLLSVSQSLEGRVIVGNSEEASPHGGEMNMGEASFTWSDVDRLLVGHNRIPCTSADVPLMLTSDLSRFFLLRNNKPVQA